MPAFFYLFTALGYGSAQLMQVCLATSLATIIVTSARSVQSHHRKGAVDWAILRGWAVWIGFWRGAGGVGGLWPALCGVTGHFSACWGVLIGLYFGFGRKQLAIGHGHAVRAEKRRCSHR